MAALGYSRDGFAVESRWAGRSIASRKVGKGGNLLHWLIARVAAGLRRLQSFAGRAMNDEVRSEADL